MGAIFLNSADASLRARLGGRNDEGMDYPIELFGRLKPSATWLLDPPVKPEDDPDGMDYPIKSDNDIHYYFLDPGFSDQVRDRLVRDDLTCPPKTDPVF